MMKIFYGKPIESKLNDWVWGGSTHKGWVVVRAIDIKSASTHAMIEFMDRTKLGIVDQLEELAQESFANGKEIRIPPWESDQHIKWEEINSPLYERVRNVGVIDSGTTFDRKDINFTPRIIMGIAVWVVMCLTATTFLILS